MNYYFKFFNKHGIFVQSFSFVTSKYIMGADVELDKGVFISRTIFFIFLIGRVVCNNIFWQKTGYLKVHILSPACCMHNLIYCTVVVMFNCDIFHGNGYWKRALVMSIWFSESSSSSSKTRWVIGYNFYYQSLHLEIAFNNSRIVN